MNTLSVSICAALLCASAAHAGVRIETVTRNSQTGQEQPLQVMQVQDGKARMESSGMFKTVSIFKNDTMYILDSQRKTYMALDKATLERTAAGMSQAMEQVRAQMAALPPERRAAMEQMMKQNGLGAMGGAAAKAAAVDVQPTDGNGTYQGKSCQLWNLTRDGLPAQQLCVVPFSSLQGSSELRELSAKIQAYLSGLSGPMRQLADNSPVQQSPEIANKLGGFPVITRQYKNGALSPEETVIKTWQSQKIDAAQFEIPAGYTKQEMPTMPATPAK